MDKSVLDESASEVSSESNRLKAAAVPGASVGTGASFSGHTATDKAKGKKSSVRIGLLVALVALSAGLAFSLPHMFGNKKEAITNGRSEKGTANRPVPVTTAVAKAGTLPVEIRTIGNVLPYSVVNVTPQVSGQLLKVMFKQGDYVSKGDLLFQIDPRTYQAALDQALGNLQRDKAMLKQAQANLQKDIAQQGQVQANLKRDKVQARFANIEQDRYRMLEEQGVISMEQRQQMSTNAVTAEAAVEGTKKAIENAQAILEADKAAIETAQGTIAADNANVETARIQLGFTQIRSPITGRTGSLNVYPGNVVSVSSGMTATPLVTIDQIQPIYVNFTVPEEYIDALRQAQAKGTLQVSIRIQGDKAQPLKGKVTFLEHTVNTGTGTIAMRAEFANDDKKLFPGQYIEVILSMPADKPCVLIPTAAVETTQQGSAVYIVKEGGTVDLRPVTVLRSKGDITGVTSGVAVGDIVVTDGTMQLSPGSRVSVTSDKDRPAGRRP